MTTNDPVVPESVLDAGEAAYDAVPEGFNAHRRALGKAFLAMQAVSPTAGDEVVERVARALFDHEWLDAGCDEQFKSDKAYWLDAALAAIAAMPKASGVEIDALQNALAETHNERAAHIDRVEIAREALLEARLALETPARRVFNDNGDHTIDTSPLDPDVYSACYYAARTVQDALTKLEGGRS